MPEPVTPQTIRELVQSGKLKLTDEALGEGHLDEHISAAIEDMADAAEEYDRDFDRGRQGYDRVFDRTNPNPHGG
jgi:hypothetical protein